MIVTFSYQLWQRKMRRQRFRCCIGVVLFMTGCRSPAPTITPITVRGVTLIAMDGTAPMEDATVVVRGNRIEVVGPTGHVRVPRDATVIDGTGKYLVPGLIDLHVHLSKARKSSLGLFVINGVTTVRDMGGDHRELLEWRRQVRTGRSVGPRILMAGPYLESASNVERMRGDPPEERVEPFERLRIPIGSPADAHRVVDSLAALELDFLKIRTVQDRDTYMAINGAANAHGLVLVGHAVAAPEEVVDAGQDGVEHFFYPTLDTLTRDQRMAIWGRLRDAGVVVVPTLVTLTRFELAPIEHLRAVMWDSLGTVEPRRRYVSRYLVRDWIEQLSEREERQRRGAPELYRRVLDSTLRNLREMIEADVHVLVGSDVAVFNVFPGSVHDELAVFVESLGLAPVDALQRATARSAAFLGIGDSVGMIREGYVADLLLLDASPLADIRNSSRIAAVIRNGYVFDRDGLEEVLQDVRNAEDLRIDRWGR